MCIQISQRRGRPTHSVWKSIKKVSFHNIELTLLDIEFPNWILNFWRENWYMLWLVSYTVSFLLLSNTFIFQGKEMEKRGASSISHHLSSTQWLKIWFAFFDLTHLWEVKPPFCLTKSNLDIIVSSVVQKAIQQQNKMGVMLLPNID